MTLRKYDSNLYYTFDRASYLIPVDVMTFKRWVRESIVPPEIIQRVRDDSQRRYIKVVLKDQFDQLLRSGVFQKPLRALEPKRVIQVGALRLSEDEYRRYLEVRRLRSIIGGTGGRHYETLK
jgi:hypothetical protein